MKQERKIALVGRKLTFAEAEEQEVLQWQEVSFEDKWWSLERLRRMFWTQKYGYYPDKMEIVGRVRRLEAKNDE